MLRLRPFSPKQKVTYQPIDTILTEVETKIQNALMNHGSFSAKIVFQYAKKTQETFSISIIKTGVKLTKKIYHVDKSSLTLELVGETEVSSPNITIQHSDSTKYTVRHEHNLTKTDQAITKAFRKNVYSLGIFT